MQLGLDLGLTRGGGVSNPAAFFTANGFTPELAADFQQESGSELYTAVGGLTDFDTLFPSFARASTATYVDSSGNLQTATSGTPRRNNHVWNGSAWVNAGLLYETEARTNMLPYSQDFTQADWVKTNTAALAVDATGPDGETSAVTLVDSGATGTGSVVVKDAGITVSATTQYTMSVFAKADQLGWMLIQAENFGSGFFPRAYFNLSAGTLGSVGADADTAQIEDFGNGWYRCSVTFTTGADTIGDFVIYVSDGDGDVTVDLDGTSSILTYGAQFEQGPTPSSYIPTAGATATRAAESGLTIPSALMPWNAAGVSIATAGRITYVDDNTSGAYVARWNVPSTTNYIRLRLDTQSVTTGRLGLYQRTDSGQNLIQFSANAYTPGINVAFSIASRNTPTAINSSVDGTAGTEVAGTSALPDLSAQDFEVAPIDVSLPFMGNIGKLLVWADDIGDTGIEEASA